MTFLDTYARYPIEIARGDGCRLQDADGRWYLDGCSGIAVMALGHRHARVLEAIHRQVDELIHVSNLYHVGVQRRFAERLVEACGGGAVFLCNSGVEAVEGAIKLVRKHHFTMGAPREEVLVLENAFHGRTLMALALTPRPKYREGFGPLPGGVRVLSAERVAAEVSERTAAVLVEPIQGEGGCRPVDCLTEIRAACDATGALLVYDEIQCGLGRAGVFRHGPTPDVMTLAKALGGGLPLGAVVASPALADTFRPGDHGSTFGGNPVACAAGLATLDVILGDDLPARCVVLGERLRTGLEAAGAEVRGRGLIVAATTDGPAAPVIDAMRQAGVLVCSAGPDAVRFLPPFISSEADIDELVAAFSAARPAAATAA